MPTTPEQHLPDVIKSRLTQIFDAQIPFNKLLGFKLVRAERNMAAMVCEFRDDFLGDVPKGILHGGVLCSLIDTTGGAAAFTALDFTKERGVNTIDMRVDFLRPARGKSFVATGTVIRKGSRIAVVEIKVKNDAGELVAAGTCAYSIFAPNPLPPLPTAGAT